MKNRVIKFRAWTTDYDYSSGQPVLIETMLEVLSIDFENDWVFVPYKVDKVSNRILSETPIMQFTGLHDKDGVEIFEGDICTKMISPDENNRAPKELYRGEIVYHYGGFCLKVDDYYYPMSRTHGVVNVIGNIYQTVNSEIGKDGKR